VVRLEDTNVDVAHALIKESVIKVTLASDLDDATEKAVAMA